MTIRSAAAVGAAGAAEAAAAAGARGRATAAGSRSVIGLPSSSRTDGGAAGGLGAGAEATGGGLESQWPLSQVRPAKPIAAGAEPQQQQQRQPAPPGPRGRARQVGGFDQLRPHRRRRPAQPGIDRHRARIGRGRCLGGGMGRAGGRTLVRPQRRDRRRRWWDGTQWRASAARPLRPRGPGIVAGRTASPRPWHPWRDARRRGSGCRPAECP